MSISLPCSFVFVLLEMPIEGTRTKCFNAAFSSEVAKIKFPIRQWMGKMLYRQHCFATFLKFSFVCISKGNYHQLSTLWLHSSHSRVYVLFLTPFVHFWTGQWNNTSSPIIFLSTNYIQFVNLSFYFTYLPFINVILDFSVLFIQSKILFLLPFLLGTSKY